MTVGVTILIAVVTTIVHSVATMTIPVAATTRLHRVDIHPLATQVATAMGTVCPARPIYRGRAIVLIMGVTPTIEATAIHRVATIITLRTGVEVIRQTEVATVGETVTGETAAGETVIGVAVAQDTPFRS